MSGKSDHGGHWGPRVYQRSNGGGSVRRDRCGSALRRVAAGRPARPQPESSVAVVEQARFPRDTLSTHVFEADGVAFLDRLGLTERLRETGAPFITRVNGRQDGFRWLGEWPRQPEDPCAIMCVRRQSSIRSSRTRHRARAPTSAWARRSRSCSRMRDASAGGAGCRGRTAARPASPSRRRRRRPQLERWPPGRRAQVQRHEESESRATTHTSKGPTSRPIRPPSSSTAGPIGLSSGRPATQGCISWC